MFKKILSFFSKPAPSESPKAPPPQASSKPDSAAASSAGPGADDRRGPRRRRPRKPAGERPEGERQQQGERAQRPQGQRPPAGQPPATATAEGGEPAKKRRRRRRKPKGEGTDSPSEERSESKPEASDDDAPRERPQRQRRPSVDAITGLQPRTSYFGDVRVSKPVAMALADMGYDAPTPIQAEVIAPMLEGGDLVGQAQTGTGKTAGFGIPLAEAVDGAQPHVQSIVLVPTRELAQQVTDELTRIFKYRGIGTVAVYGGAPIGRQIQGLEAGAQVVVGTPGRVIDLLDRGHLRLDQVKTVVLDEADQMLDIGFLPDIRKILRQTPRERQTALFTATVPTQIRRLIYSYFKEPKMILIGQESEPVESVRQMFCEVANRDKLTALREVFETIDAGEQTLVFRRTQGDVDWLVRMLQQRRMPAAAIHGGLPQGERNKVMQDFRDGKLKILVSTNLTSRGIDVPAVAHVINYDCPEQVEEYVHRIGRTARMGREGTAVTFVGEWDNEFFDAIKAHVGIDKLEEIKLQLYGGPDDAPSDDADSPSSAAVEQDDAQPQSSAAVEQTDTQPAEAEAEQAHR